MHDTTAHFLITVLLERGLRIPDDISIVGMDDDQISREMHPGLSTIHVPVVRIGSRAYDELNDLIVKGPPQDPEIITLPVEFINRETLLEINKR